MYWERTCVRVWAWLWNLPWLETVRFMYWVSKFILLSLLDSEFNLSVIFKRYRFVMKLSDGLFLATKRGLFAHPKQRKYCRCPYETSNVQIRCFSKQWQYTVFCWILNVNILSHVIYYYLIIYHQLPILYVKKYKHCSPTWKCFISYIACIFHYFAMYFCFIRASTLFFLICSHWSIQLKTCIFATCEVWVGNNFLVNKLLIALFT